jgi:hypothetical protein
MVHFVRVYICPNSAFWKIITLLNQSASSNSVMLKMNVLMYREFQSGLDMQRITMNDPVSIVQNVKNETFNYRNVVLNSECTRQIIKRFRKILIVVIILGQRSSDMRLCP